MRKSVETITQTKGKYSMNVMFKISYKDGRVSYAVASYGILALFGTDENAAREYYNKLD